MNWAYGPIRGYLLVQGWSNKVIMGMVEEEEIRIVYDSSKYVRGEKLSRK